MSVPTRCEAGDRVPYTARPGRLPRGQLRLAEVPILCVKVTQTYQYRWFVRDWDGEASSSTHLCPAVVLSRFAISGLFVGCPGSSSLLL